MECIGTLTINNQKVNVVVLKAQSAPVLTSFISEEKPEDILKFDSNLSKNLYEDIDGLYYYQMDRLAGDLPKEKEELYQEFKREATELFTVEGFKLVAV